MQTDRTADSMKAIIGDIAAIKAAKPITAEERNRSIANSVLALPGEFERGTAFLSAMERNQILGRPDDYYVTAARRLGALTTADLNRAVQLFDTDKLLWIVVGRSGEGGAAAEGAGPASGGAQRAVRQGASGGQVLVPAPVRLSGAAAMSVAPCFFHVTPANAGAHRPDAPTCVLVEVAGDGPGVRRGDVSMGSDVFLARAFTEIEWVQGLRPCPPEAR